MAGDRTWPGSVQRCSECGSEMKYRGLGEFICQECGNVVLNDYGRVRAYLEEHPGATQTEVSKATGVSPNRIRQLLMEERIEISANSSVFLFCEMCGAPIRSGVRCLKCEEKYKKGVELERKSERVHSNISGHAMGAQGHASGEIRFVKK